MYARDRFPDTKKRFFSPGQCWGVIATGNTHMAYADPSDRNSKQLDSVVNTGFVNFQDNATRKSGALSYLLYSSFPISTNNDVEGPKFENAKPVYFPPPERRWSFSGEFGRFTGWNGAVFHDIDGSVGGVPDSSVVIDNGIADDDKTCQIKPDWNAAV